MMKQRRSNSIIPSTKETRQAIVIQLPVELITIDILPCLPVKSLLRFKCVSKSWYEWINSEEFVQLHLRRTKEKDADGTLILVGPSSLHSFDFNHSHHLATELYCPEFAMGEHVTLEGSSNGLVCFYDSMCFTLYNPATRAYKQVPPPPLTRKTFSYWRKFFTHLGEFAYDCVANDYKVLSFTSYFGNNINSKVDEESYCYCLKANSWKVIGNPPWGASTNHQYRSVCVNNYLHWTDDTFREISKAVGRLDLSTLRYDTMSLPKEAFGHSQQLAVLRGHLHVITCGVDIWMLKEYGVDESWTRIFYSPAFADIVYKTFLRPMPYAYSRDGRKILVGFRHSNTLICCDLKYQEVSALKHPITGLTTDSSDMIWLRKEPWVETLVPL